VSVLRVLHGAGNIRDLLPLATHPAVDAIEADIWVRGDQLVAHHDRPLGPLPLTIGGTGIHREDTDPVMLREILEAVGSHTRVVLDLRSWLADPAPDLARELLRIEDRSHLTVSCEAWQIADRLRAWMPDLRVAYRGSARPIAIRHDLLHTPEEVDALRRHAGTIAAWTVDDVDRALELAAWRVDAIVSNHLTVLNAL
jgi:glycerophosphoryl diester phosphodiesterase